jgi:hypothetical protein
MISEHPQSGNVPIRSDQGACEQLFDRVWRALCIEEISRGEQSKTRNPHAFCDNDALRGTNHPYRDVRFLAQRILVAVAEMKERSASRWSDACGGRRIVAFRP